MKRSIILSAMTIGCLLALICIKAEIVGSPGVSIKSMQPKKSQAIATDCSYYAPSPNPLQILSDEGKEAIGFSAKSGGVNYYNPKAYYLNLSDLSNFTKIFDASDVNSYPIDGEWLNNDIYYVYLARMTYLTGSVPLGFYKFDVNTGESELIGGHPTVGVDKSVKSMTYDYSSKQMYIVDNDNYLSTINLSTGEITPIALLSQKVAAIGCTYNGKLYGVTFSTFNWVRIDKETAKCTTIGNTGLLCQTDETPSSLAFDHENDFTAYYSYGNVNGKNEIASIDMKTGKATNLGSLPENTLVTALTLSFGFASGAPAHATEFKCTPASDGSLNATLNWKYPNLTYGGNTLKEITKAEIYANGNLIETLTSGLTPGSNATHKVNVNKADIYEYEVVLYNSKGRSSAMLAPAKYIGKDIPGKVQNLQAQKNKNVITVTWAAPTQGMHQGYFKPTNLTYKLTRLPDNKILATALTETKYTDNSLTDTRNYAYMVECSNSIGTGESATSNYLLVGDPLELPYYADFVTEKGFREWTIIDGNKDGVMWHCMPMKTFEGIKGMAEFTHTNNEDCEDWLISPPINMPIGNYNLKMDIDNLGAEDYTLELYAGTSISVSDLKTKLADLPLSGNNITTLNAPLTQNANGTLVLGFKVTGTLNGLQLSNFMIEKALDTDATLSTIKGPDKPTVNKPVTYTTTVINKGTDPFRQFTLQLENLSGKILATKDITFDLALNKDAQQSISIDWTPDTPGKDTIRARVILEDDENLKNDYSRMMEVNVNPEGYEQVLITNVYRVKGDGFSFKEEMEAHFLYGLNVYSPQSFHQCIYTAKDLKQDKGGTITGIQYYFGDPRRKNTKVNAEIYMSNTEESELLSWIEPENQHLVYKGTVDINPSGGVDILHIDLQEPFTYTGKNICISIKTEIAGPLNYNLIWVINNDYSNPYACRMAKTEDGGSIQAGEGVHYAQTDWIGMDFILNNENLKGVVTDKQGNPLKDVKVTVSNKQKDYVYTDERGAYRFCGLSQGNYKVSFNNWKYVPVEASVNIKASQVITQDAQLILTTTHNLKGIIESSTHKPLAGTQIRLKGKGDLKIYTDDKGEFNLPQIPEGIYEMTIFNASYRMYQQNIDLKSDKNLGTITMEDIPVEVTKVTPTYNENGSVDVSWKAPSRETTFSWFGNYGNAGVSLSGSITNGLEQVAYSTIFTTPSILNTVSWIIAKTNDPEAVDLVDLYIFALDEGGTQTNQILFSQKNIKSNLGDWTHFTLPEWIEAPHGFALAIAAKEHLYLGVDDGRELVKGVNFVCMDYEVPYFNTNIEDAGMGIYRNYMLCAKGVKMEDYDDPVQKAKQLNVVQPTTNTLLEKVNLANVLPAANFYLPQVITNNNEIICKLVASENAQAVSQLPELAPTNATYKVWRVEKGSEMSTKDWTLITPEAIKETTINDADFVNAKPGIYRYIVKTIYPNVSADNVMSKEFVYNGPAVTVKVTPNSEAEGAIVSLINTDGSENSFKLTADAAGIAKFPHILPGNYTLRVVQNGFEVYEKEEIINAQQATYTFNVALKEKVTNVYVSMQNSPDSENNKLLVWNNQGDYNLFDDFESEFKASKHPEYICDYTEGKVAWQYNNVDQHKLSNGIHAIQLCAFAIFNMYGTTPPIPLFTNTYPYSGDKVLISNIAAEGKDNTGQTIKYETDHYIISPELHFSKDFTFSFMAMCYSYNYTGEPYRVGYSTTDSRPESFQIIDEGNIINTQWLGYEYTIPAEAKYVMINHHGIGEMTLIIDDVFIGYPDEAYMDMMDTPKRPAMYEIDIDGNKIGTTTEKQFLLENVNPEEEHTYGVTAVYPSGTRIRGTIQYGGAGIENESSTSFRLYPNPATEWIQVESGKPITEVKITNTSGMMLMEEKTSGENRVNLNVGHLASGLYIVIVTSGEQTFTHKLTITK